MRVAPVLMHLQYAASVLDQRHLALSRSDRIPYCTNIVLIHLKFLPNLAMCSSDASGLTIGSTVSIAEVTSQLEQAETAVFQKNAEHIKRVASVLILSVAS